MHTAQHQRAHNGTTISDLDAIAAVQLDIDGCAEGDAANAVVIEEGLLGALSFVEFLSLGQRWSQPAMVAGASSTRPLPT